MGVGAALGVDGWGSGGKSSACVFGEGFHALH